MSTKVSKNGWRQRIPGKAADSIQQYGSTANHQAEGEWCWVKVKEENSLGWGDPGGLGGLEERADMFGAAGRDMQMPQAEEKEKNVWWEVEARAEFCGDHWQLFVGNLRWSVRLEGHHRPCQQVCWRRRYSNGWGYGSRWSFLWREGKETDDSPAAVAR